MVKETDDFAGFHSHAIIFVALKTTFLFSILHQKGLFYGALFKLQRKSGQTHAWHGPISV